MGDLIRVICDDVRAQQLAQLYYEEKLPQPVATKKTLMDTQYISPPTGELP